MRLIIIIMTTCLLQVSASTFGQQVTLSEKNVSLEKIFQLIRQQTGYDFLYDGKEIQSAKPVDVNFKNLDLRGALKKCLEDQGFEFEIGDKAVVVTKKTNSLIDRIAGVLMSIDIRGVVTDENNKPLPGAVIKVKGTNRSTAANDKGEFFLGNVDEKAILIIAYVGYESREVTAGKDLGALSLKLANNALEEVNVTVNTGYQILPKERATGSFALIDNAKLNEQVGSNILNRLESITSGLNMNKNQDRSGLGITIRGLSTINGNTSPLIVLDNFPYEGNINNINPNDVESVTVLKDAAAASIWGTKAANGVIVITTKRAKLNTPLEIEFNSSFQVYGKRDLGYLQSISSPDFIELEKDLFSKGYFNRFETSSSKPGLSPVVELLIAARDHKVSQEESNRQIERLKSLNWKDDFLKNVYQNSFNQQYALSIRGGSEKMSNFLSFGYDNNRSDLNSGFTRLNLRSNNLFNPIKKLQITTDLSLSYAKSTTGKLGYETITGLYPYYQIKNEDATPNSFPILRESYVNTAGNGKLLDWHYYPLTENDHMDRNNNVLDVVANIGVNYQLLKGLAVDLKYQFERQPTVDEVNAGEESFFTRDLINRFTQIDQQSGVVKNNIPVGNILDRNNGLTLVNNLRSQLNFDHKWGRSNLTAIAGMEVRQKKRSENLNRVYGFNDDILTAGKVDYISPFKDFLTGSTRYIEDKTQVVGYTDRFVSQYFNSSYVYNSKYTVSASLRRDASNLFGVGTNDKWQPLWHIGALWNISSEKFYPLGFFPILKLRATYGSGGTVDQSKSAVTTIKYSPTPDPNNNFPFAYLNTFPNPNLRWEKSYMLNIGLDFASKNNVFFGSIEYYSKKGIDLFGPQPIDYTAGVGSQFLTVNVANMKGHGIDADLNLKVLNRRVNWVASTLISYNADKVTKYNLVSTSGSSYAGTNFPTPVVGYPIYSILSYKWAGLDNSGRPQGIVDGKPSTDYSAITGEQTQISDLVFSGRALPSVFGSFINTLQYKGFGLSMNIGFKFGYYFRRQSINYSRLLAGSLPNGLINGFRDFEKRWQKPGDELVTNVPAFIYPVIYSSSTFYDNAEILVEKGDNIRLNYINLSYTVDKRTFKQSPFKNLSVYFNASNLGLLWTANKYGLDPDISSSGIPTPKSFALGLRGSF